MMESVDEGGMAVVCVSVTSDAEVIQREVIVNLLTIGGSATSE